MMRRLLRRIRRKPDYQRIAWLERECGLADPVADDYFAKWTLEPGAVWSLEPGTDVRYVDTGLLFSTRAWQFFDDPIAVRAAVLDAQARSSAS